MNIPSSHTQCLQIFGGYGYMMEYPVQRAFRDTRLGTIGAGTTEILNNPAINGHAPPTARLR